MEPDTFGRLFRYIATFFVLVVSASMVLGALLFLLLNWLF